MAMSLKLKNKLSAAVVGLILAGASAPVILDQFLDEKEGNSLTAYRDGGGLWTICRGATMVDGKPAEILNANVGFMAVQLPEGTHSVELHYETPNLRTGAILSLVGVVIVIGLVILSKKQKNTKANNGLNR